MMNILQIFKKSLTSIVLNSGESYYYTQEEFNSVVFNTFVPLHQIEVSLQFASKYLCIFHLIQIYNLIMKVNELHL
jgi:hypothetical protein